LSIDPQGLTRRFDKEGNVTESAEMDKRVLDFVDIYKSSIDEIKLLTGKLELRNAIAAVHDFGPKIVIVTMGARGSVLSDGEGLVQIPVCKPSQVVDPTGAGDVFIGAFLAEYIRGKAEPFWCSCVGSAAASVVVEGVGTSYFGEKAEIYRRARVVCEKEIKH
jgi:sugar/nucleoside kinase (ribokinase family)